MQQRAEREIRQPDFLFCAADTGENKPYPMWIVRTSTSNWLNNAVWNGNTNGEGPGVIQPPIKITFHKLGADVLTFDNGSPGRIFNQGWGSFDDSTNLPIVYPATTYNNAPFIVQLHFRGSSNNNNSYDIEFTNHTWNFRASIGEQAALQISTNQINWASLATVINAGAVIEWYHLGTTNPPKFFRVTPL
jgi:hypothetical protein